jgi:gliding motility-associated-like protein
MKKFYFISTLLLSILFLGTAKKASAQFDFVVEVCADSQAVVDLVDTVFLAGVNPQSIANITFYGDPSSVGYFKGGYFLGFKRPQGIVMTDGKSDDVDKSNVCNVEQNASTNNSGVEGDADLEKLAGVASHDGCIIEFDFKPTADTVRFNYVFASEEYHEYVKSSYNDMFGFFLSGPGLSGPYTNDAENIALIPGTTTGVAINTINFGKGGVTCTGKPGGCNHCEWFKDNSQSSDPAFHIFVYDGLTKSLTAKAGMEQCEWYHIKLAISDGGDAIYDSGVLLEGGSFNAGNITSVTDYTHPTIDSLVYESCNNHEAILYFAIEEPMGFPYIIPFKVEGSATRDVDYKLLTTHPGDTIMIEPGDTYDSVIIKPFYDSDIEGIEDVQVIYNSVMCSIFAIPDTAIVLIDDLPIMRDTSLQFPVYCEDTALLSFESVLSGVSPYAYNWYSFSPPKDTPEVEFVPSGYDYYEVYVVIDDTCGQQVSDTAYVIVPELVADAGPDQSLCNEPEVTLQGSSPGAQTFWWTATPADGSLAGQEDIPNPVVSPTVTTLYEMEVTDNCTHDDIDTTFVLLDEAVADAGPDQNMCFNDSVTLSCNEGESYLWTASPPDAGLAGQQDQQTIKVSPTTTTVYTVKVTNDCGYSATDDLEVTVHALPNADAGNDDEVCFHQPYDLQASGGTSYFWTSVPVDTSLSGQETLPNPTVTPGTQEDYTYFVTVTNANNCSNKDSMVLRVNPVPELSLSPDNETICYGDPVTISVVGDADYSWTADPPDATLAGQENNQVITVTPLETTTYTLVGVVSGFSCPATITQTIVVTPELLSTFAMQDNEVCQNGAFVVNYTGNATPSATYTWNFDGATVNSGSGPGPWDISWDTEGNKTITLTVNENGCPSNETANTLTVLKSPITAFDANPVEGCVPFDVEFTNNTTNQSSQVSYEWDFGNGTTSSEESPTISYTEAGNYTVSLTSTNDQKCADVATQAYLIKANETPTAQFVAEPPAAILEDATINFTDKSVSSETLVYDWDFDDGSTSGDKNPTHTYSATGVYLVNLLVTSPNGCESETTTEVTIHPDFAVYAPSAFTPNGDGKNDLFEVKGVGIKTYHLQIYSRWGELVYESNSLDPSDRWDGKYNGTLVPPATYAYTISYTSMLDADFKIQGTVTVMY